MVTEALACRDGVQFAIDRDGLPGARKFVEASLTP
jgi:hypothetical protein